MVMGTVSLIVAIGGIVIAAINHKRLRSKCCGRKLEASIDIENTTPPRLADPPAPAPVEKS